MCKVKPSALVWPIGTGIMLTMNMKHLPRRDFLLASAVTAAASATVGMPATARAQAPKADSPFRYCLNMSTIRGQKLTIVEEIEVAAKAGYEAIEPWMGKLNDHVKGGGTLKDLGKRISDHGITVESAIGFANWIVDDDAKRAEGLENARKDMDMLAEIGGKRIAAPPAGANNAPKIDLFVAAERYRALLEVGAAAGVIPQIEVWGFSKNLSRLGETVFVATEAGHPDACILPDVYHIFKGGSDFAGLKLLDGAAVPVFHMNDYPATPAREEMNDSHRVYTGDGVAPITDILRMLRDAGGETVLSLELFNKDYWKQPALDVAKTGLEKMKASVAKL